MTDLPEEVHLLAMVPPKAHGLDAADVRPVPRVGAEQAQELPVMIVDALGRHRLVGDDDTDGSCPHACEGSVDSTLASHAGSSLGSLFVRLSMTDGSAYR